MEEQLSDIKTDHYREILQQGKDITITVNGFSMWPFLRNGDRVIVRAAHIKDIARGDIVLTCTDKRIFCHRVFIKRPDYIQTKADALIGLDARAHQAEIIGKVMAKDNRGRIHRMDSAGHSVAGFLISWMTLMLAPCYPVLGRLKRILLENLLYQRPACAMEEKTS